MPWTYRIGRRRTPIGPAFSITEIYFDKQSRVTGYIEGVAPCAESVREVAGDLRLMLRAVRRPVMDLDALDRRFARSKTMRIRFSSKPRRAIDPRR